MPKDPEYEQDRIIALRKSLAFAQKQGDLPKVNSKLSLISTIHNENGSFVESALALLLSVQAKPWIKIEQPESPREIVDPKEAKKRAKVSKKERRASEDPVPAVVDPNEGKERDYHKAINLFDKGKYWELAITLLRELRAESREIVMSTMDLVVKERDFFLKVRHQDRFWESYFFVEVFGRVDEILRTTPPEGYDEGHRLPEQAVVFRGSEAQVC
jgi:dedicator of cytokinesis protein 1